MSAILEVNNLKKNFGGVTAVEDFSFQIEEGSRMGIIGPNGAGKTTTFNVIAGNYNPTEGSIKFDGEDITGLRPSSICKKGVARTFQVVSVFEEMTVREHVEMGSIARRSSITLMGGSQFQDIDSLLEFTMLGDIEDKLAKNLTTAAQKRLGLATALATGPRLLLLDELMAGLNFQEIDEMMDLLCQINEEYEITLVVVEHVMKAVMGLSNRVIVLHNGKKLAEGSPEEISENQAVIDAYLGEEA